MLTTTGERRSRSFTWRVRTREKQTAVDQKAISPRSASAEGRAVKPDYKHGPRSR